MEEINSPSSCTECAITPFRSSLWISMSMNPSSVLDQVGWGGGVTCTGVSVNSIRCPNTVSRISLSEVKVLWTQWEIWPPWNVETRHLKKASSDGKNDWYSLTSSDWSLLIMLVSISLVEIDSSSLCECSNCWTCSSHDCSVGCATDKALALKKAWNS